MTVFYIVCSSIIAITEIILSIYFDTFIWLGIIMAVIPAWIASTKKRNFWGWYLLGLISYGIAFIAAMIISEQSDNPYSSINKYTLIEERDDDQSVVEVWRCCKCDRENQITDNFCSNCGAEKGDYKQLSKENAKTVKEYIQRQLELSDISDMNRVQSSYFNTSSLSYLKIILPDINLISNLEEYKKQLKSILADLENS